MTKTSSYSASAADFSKYDAGFFDSFSVISYRAAQTILRELSGTYSFSSVADFGCGSATWLRAAREIILENGGRPRLLGIDGEYARKIVDPNVAEFLFANIEESVRLDEKFDLAISLEVAEHLSSGRADSFIDDLCNASDVVLFGAAIPGQGGTNHINEQWQDYWFERFMRRGYIAIDLFKQRFWNDPTFTQCPYYVANTFLYVRQGHTLLTRSLPIVPAGHWSLRVAHPSLFASNHFDAASFSKTFKSIPAKFLSAVYRRIRKATEG